MDFALRPNLFVPGVSLRVLSIGDWIYKADKVVKKIEPLLIACDTFLYPHFKIFKFAGQADKQNICQILNLQNVFTSKLTFFEVFSNIVAFYFLIYIEKLFQFFV